MKRVGNIFGAVVERGNLREAFLKASRGKRSHADQRRITALTAFVAAADSRGFRQWYFRAHPISGNSNRVLRGGSYNNDASNCAFAYRNNNNPSNDWNNNGFRLFCRPAWNDRFDPGICPVSDDGTNDGIRPDASSACRTLRGGGFA